MRAFRTFIASIGLAFAAAAGAGTPTEDYKAALDSYQRGDVRNAISILRKHADAGDGPSQAFLGNILDLAEQNEEAVEYFRKAAAQGVPDGYYGLAVMYSTGEGVKKDMKQAREWMVKAAEAGHRQATLTVALAYIQGGLDVAPAERASPEALRWVQRAVELDSLPAIERLAGAYRRGELGLVADAKRADELDARARTLRNEAPAKAGKKKPQPVKTSG